MPHFPAIVAQIAFAAHEAAETMGTSSRDRRNVDIFASEFGPDTSVPADVA